jgi:hypothetical protein
MVERHARAAVILASSALGWTDSWEVGSNALFTETRICV